MVDYATVGSAVLQGGLQAASSFLSASAAKKAAKKEYKRAKEFAQNSIQWRVADAEAAGVHPLYALGAPTMSYSGSSVGVDPVGAALDSMGQNIGRAASALWSPEDKIGAQLSALAVERGELENAKLRSEIMLMRQPASPRGGVATAVGGPLPKANRLRSGGIEISRDANGNAFWIPPGMDAQMIADNFGDIAQEAWGAGRAVNSAGHYIANSPWWIPEGSGAEAVWRYFQ